MNEQKIKRFMERLQIESTYKKYLKDDIINQMINIFSHNCTTIKKQNYPSRIENPLELALKYYKEYNLEYYNTIIKNIENGRISIKTSSGKSYTDTQNNTTNIRLCGNDSDLFNIVHELAHFIDRNSIPPIVPNEYYFLSETFAFYIEQELESWLGEEYKKLIAIRRNNRIYFESKMLIAIENELYYENLYRQKGTIETSDIDTERIKSIVHYDIPTNIINCLLQYPLANILSNYLINNHLLQSDNELVAKCFSIDLYKAIVELFNKIPRSKINVLKKPAISRP